MAPRSSRQVLIWSLPTLAFLLSLLWYRRKRAASIRSDPGGTSQSTDSSVKAPVCNTDQPASIPQTDSESVVPSTASEEPVAEISSEAKVEPVLEVAELICISSVNASTTDAYIVKQVNEDKSLYTPLELGPEVITAVKSEEPGNHISYCVTEEAAASVTVEELSFTVQSAAPVTVEQSSFTVQSTVPITAEESSFTVQSTEPVTVEESSFTIQSTAPVTVEESSFTIQSTEPVTVKESSFTVQSTESSSIESEEIVQGTAADFTASDSSSEESSEELMSQVTLTPTNLPPGELNIDSLSELSTDHNSNISQERHSESKIEPSEKNILEEVSSTNLESLSVVMAHISSEEAPSVDTHNNNELVLENAMLECKVPSLQCDSGVSSEAAADVHGVSTDGAMGAAAVHQGNERDSANHSPADVMLASPSISSYSDEGSSDSGKGCSDVATPPSRTPASGSSLSGDVPVPCVYEFVLPQQLVGRLIGRLGCFVHQIKAKTNASILIKKHPDTTKLKICAVEGTQADIDSALEMIRQKFPAKRYPSVTLEQVSFLPSVPTFPLAPEFFHLQLVEGVNNDVILSSLVSTSHFFLQQPTHPTFPALNRLNTFMNMCYSEPTAPLLPMPTEAGVICVAPAMGGWYRAQVVSVDAESEKCDIKFVDYGGYMTIDCCMLRQIRSDFMTLPFQAAECHLANVVPIGGEEDWSQESYAGMEELTHRQVLQAQICTYTEDGLPVVYIFAIHDSQVVLVNQELVARGLAEWVEPSHA